jgi:putative NADPH-quinone reductase
VLDPLVQAHVDDVQAAEALVFVYPTWWSTLPAILKGWLERVMVPGVGFRFNAAGRVTPGLTNVHRLVGISTYGSPRRYVWATNDNGRRTITRALRLSTGLRTRSTWLALYGIDDSTAAERDAFVQRVATEMGRL